MISLTLNYLIHLKHRPCQVKISYIKLIPSIIDMSITDYRLNCSNVCGFKWSFFSFLHVKRNIADSLWCFASNIRLVLVMNMISASRAGDQCLIHGRSYQKLESGSSYFSSWREVLQMGELTGVRISFKSALIISTGKALKWLKYCLGNVSFPPKQFTSSVSSKELYVTDRYTCWNCY